MVNYSGVWQHQSPYSETNDFFIFAPSYSFEIIAFNGSCEFTIFVPSIQKVVSPFHCIFQKFQSNHSLVKCILEKNCIGFLWNIRFNHYFAFFFFFWVSLKILVSEWETRLCWKDVTFQIFRVYAYGTAWIKPILIFFFFFFFWIFQSLKVLHWWIGPLMLSFSIFLLVSQP